MDKLKSCQLPRFTKERAGKSARVTMETRTYITLLVCADVTDPAFWPPGLEAGAGAVARVQQIETQYRSPEGVFDWEKLPAQIQDEYDLLCLSLDRLLDHGPVD